MKKILLLMMFICFGFNMNVSCTSELNYSDVLQYLRDDISVQKECKQRFPRTLSREDYESFNIKNKDYIDYLGRKKNLQIRTNWRNWIKPNAIKEMTPVLNKMELIRRDLYEFHNKSGNKINRE